MDKKIRRLLELSGVDVKRMDDETTEFNPEDKVRMDIPLLIRIMEWARETAKTDMQLHKVAENMTKLSSEPNRTLTMDDYDAIFYGVQHTTEPKDPFEIKGKNINVDDDDMEGEGSSPDENPFPEYPSPTAR